MYEGSPEKQNQEVLCTHTHTHTLTDTSPKTYRVRYQTGNPGEPMVQFWSESEGLGTRRALGVVLVQKLSGWRPRRSQCSSSKAGKNSFRSKAVKYKEPPVTQEMISLFFPFNLLADLLGHTHISQSKLSLPV